MTRQLVHVASFLSLAAFATLLPLGRAAAQQVALAAQGPRVLVAAATSGATPVEVDASRILTLRQKVSLDLDGIPLADALDAIADQTGIRFVYVRSVLPVDSLVRFNSGGITVAAALTELLLGLHVDVLVSGADQVTLVRSTARRVAPGTVTGRVTDAKTGVGLVGADVRLDGTRWRAGTDEDGRYRLSNVVPGSYTLSVRRIGYAQQSRPVTVVEDKEIVVDVALEPVPTQLDEVVTTVTGEQRLRELGHVVGRINADSLVREAPVSSVTELLNARVPGLQVFTSSGEVGGSTSLRIRGTTSLRLNLEPIVIVDGVRYNTSGGGTTSEGPFRVDPSSRLNDLNPNDIASIEVVKGPSAATLYGTDAANGVIVITTKKGRAGPARWNAYVRGTMNEIPKTDFPDNYWGWQTIGGEPSTTSSCTLRDVADGDCVQDSVTVIPNPLNDPALTIFGAKPRWEYGANVSGGSEALQYYFSGDFEDATGPLQMPPEVAEALRAQRGGELPTEQLEPNAFTKFNLRGNVTAGLGEQAQLRANVGYTQSGTRTMTTSSNPYRTGAFRSTPTDPYTGATPGGIFAQTSTERINRFYGSALGEWRPAAWLHTRATVGLDVTSSHRYSLQRRGEPDPSELGVVGDDRSRTLVTTADLGATATFGFGRLSSRTSVGAQYVRNLYDGVNNTGRNLPPGGASIAEAENVSTSQSYSETVTLGTYVEQVFGLNDRLFVSGAIRADGASTFGSDYNAAIYPKAGVSWIVSEEPWLPRLPGLDEVRLRYAYGAAGQQPTPDMRNATFVIEQQPHGGTLTNVVSLTQLGSPNLRPERVKEHEFGLDASALQGRMQLNLTWNQRRTVDQVTLIPLPAGLGRRWTNLGLITGRGFEAQLTARLLDTRAISWDLMLTHAFNTDEVVDLGGAGAAYSTLGGWVEGYPVGARFMIPLLGYEDANGDGIIEDGEAIFGDTAVYVGRSTPSRTQTFTGVIGLFEHRVRLSALLERRGGFTQYDEVARVHCRANRRCRAAVDPATPLLEQAALITSPTPSGQFQTRYTPLSKGDFTRLREVTVAIDLPQAWTRAVRVGRTTLSLSGRNLALWTDFGGPDPESAQVFARLSAVAAEGIPQARVWTVRLDVGF